LFRSRRFPHLGRRIRTAGDNPQPVRGKGRRQHIPQVPSERLQGQVSLPLPVVPFKTTARCRLRVFQQFPQPTDIVLLPSLLGQVQVGHIEEAASLGFPFFSARRLASSEPRLMQRQHGKATHHSNNHARQAGGADNPAPMRRPFPCGQLRLLSLQGRPAFGQGSQVLGQLARTGKTVLWIPREAMLQIVPD